MFPETTSVTASQPSSYATGSDFCRIFAEDMRGLYTLALLLTADGAEAEKCFLSALEDSSRTTRVFKEWARSWTRRAVMQRAVGIQRPALYRPAVTHREADRSSGQQSGFPMEAVLGLPTFERFVFVMSVLERCSDQECAVLLGCSRVEVANGRARALDALMADAQGTIPGTQFIGTHEAVAGKSA